MQMQPSRQQILGEEKKQLTITTQYLEARTQERHDQLVWS